MNLNLFGLLAVSGLVLILLSTFTRVPLWVGCFLVGLVVVLQIVR